ncbi:MAG: GNAT family N-acetyltransferase [Leptolyngbya sp.]|nr:GNAT family N-acetyltransferase [Candidatus Melainabacteria bacterium]
MGIQIDKRPVEASDAATLLALTMTVLQEFNIERLQKSYGELSAESFAEDFRLPCAWSRILFVNGSPAGYLLVHAKLEDPAVLELAKLYIYRQYRKLGLGRFLLEEAFAEASARSVSKIYLSTAREFGVLGFYQHLGFVEVEDLRYPNQVNSIAMEIVLDLPE